MVMELTSPKPCLGKTAAMLIAPDNAWVRSQELFYLLFFFPSEHQVEYVQGTRRRTVTIISILLVAWRGVPSPVIFMPPFPHTFFFPDRFFFRTRSGSYARTQINFLSSFRFALLALPADSNSNFKHKPLCFTLVPEGSTAREDGLKA
jgi:hypothetical protein